MKTILDSFALPILRKQKTFAIGLWGDPGIGKSFTLESFLSDIACPYMRFHATTDLTQVCLNLPKPAFSKPWLRTYFTKLERAEFLSSEDILLVLTTLLPALSPFVLSFEDAHEASQEQLELLNSLVKRLANSKGLGIVITSRFAPPDAFIASEVTALNKDRSDQLLQGELGSTLPGDALSWIYNKSQGNPLYALEYLRFFIRQGNLWNDSTYWRWRQPDSTLMPATIEALIELMLGKLTPEDLAGLEIKALLPIEATDDHWARAWHRSIQEILDLKKRLHKDHIFRDGQFAHPLYREVLVNLISDTRRQTIAKRLVEVYRDQPLLAVLFIQDARLEPKQSSAFLKQAAELAQQRGDRVLSGTLLAQMTLYLQAEEKGVAALSAARLLDGLDYPKVLELSEIAAEMLDDPTEAHLLKAKTLALQGKYVEMLSTLAYLPEDQKVGTSWHETYLHLLYLASQHEALIDHWQTKVQPGPISSTALGCVAWSYLHLGKSQLALELIQTHLAEQVDDLELLNAKASMAFFQGDYASARDLFKRCLVIKGEIFDQDTVSYLRNHAVCQMQLGFYVETVADLHQALNFYSLSGNSIYYAQTLVMMSYVYLELDHAETERILFEAIEILSKVPAQAFLSHAYAQLSSFYLGKSSLLAKKYANNALRIAYEVSDKTCLLVANHALSRAELIDRPELALKLAGTALDIALEMDQFEGQLSAFHAQGLAYEALAMHEQAKQVFERAFQAAKSMPLESRKFGLELDRLEQNLEAASAKLQWFDEHQFKRASALVKAYFPQLDDLPKEITSLNIRLNVLGSIQVVIGETEYNIKGKKRHSLLSCLLESRLSGKRDLPMPELCDLLYPNQPDFESQKKVWDLVYSLRSQIHERFILSTETGYQLGDVATDAEAFLKSGETHLWRGQFLENESSLPLEIVRERLYSSLFEAATKLTDLWEKCRIGRLLIDYDPYHKGYLGFYLGALRESSNHKSLSRAYQLAKARFFELGEILPERYQSFLDIGKT